MIRMLKVVENIFYKLILVIRLVYYQITVLENLKVPEEFIHCQEKLIHLTLNVNTKMNLSFKSTPMGPRSANKCAICVYRVQ